VTRPERPIAADWLAVRRAADTVARDGASGLLRELTRRTSGTLTVFDVGAGTGANQAYLAPRLGVGSRWVLLDHDADLLNAPGNGAAERVLGGIGELDRMVSATSGERLITCSALLDLLTTADLDELAAVLARHRVSGLFCLTVDGSVRFEPSHRFDDAVADAFNAHQSRDGRPGPAAAAYLTARCEELGLAVRQASTPWLLDADSAPLVGRLLAERADAAVEWRPELARSARLWLADRQRSLDQGVLTVRVGHVDLLVTADAE